jgi:hypothetical protein
MKRIGFVLSFLLSFTLVYSQTGPAGVGNFDGSAGQPENIIWLDASTLGLSDTNPILLWPDLSGNNNDLVQLGSDNTPLFETNGLFSGSYSVARFDGTERYLTLTDNADLDNNLGGITIIAVIYNATLGGARGIYSKRVSSGSERSYNSFTYTASRLNFDIDNGSNRRLASSASLNTTTDYISTNRYSGSLQEIYLQSVQSGSASISGDITDSNSNLILGALNENYGTYFDGDIAELIFYREGINDAERLIVENYLSQKYGIAIANDFFGTDAVFNTSFVNDIVGIGTSNGSDKFSSSGFSDALQISELNSSLNSTNEFVMIGHDNTAHADGVTTDLVVDPGVLDSRWARSWYSENSGSVSVKMTFDFGDAGLPFSGTASDYVLLYRANTSDNYTRFLVNSYSVENGDQLVVDVGNISLPTGYYTIGEGAQLLPGNWYSFQSGDWNDPLTWTTVPDGSLRSPVIGGVPTSTDNVTILSGRKITMDTDDNDGVLLAVDGELDLVNTSGHDFFSISGSGTISLAGDVSQNDNFPTGGTTVFADSIVGGTVAINGTGVNLDQNRNYNNLIINMTGTADIAVMLADYTVNGDLTISNGILQINDNSATTALSITANGNVQIDANGELKVGTANARHEFNFYGDFLNSGIAEFTNRVAPNYTTEATDGIIDANFLSGTEDQLIDCFGVTNFYRIEIDKGVDQTYILDINASAAANFNLFGPADYGHSGIAQLISNDNAIGLLKGTLRLNTNVDIPVLNNTGNYNISEAARLWVNGGSASKPSGTAIVPYGTVQLSAGTLDAPINSGITTRDNGNIIVEGGVMTVNQIRTSILGADNIGGYTQSGGTVNVTGNTISTNYYAFSLTYPGNTFNMSGGTLNVAGAPTGATTGGIFIASNATNQNITGGTVVMEIDRNNDFKLTSVSPFWNVIMRYTSGTGSEVDIIDGTSGTGGGATTLPSVDLRVLNNLTIESGIILDHNGNDVEIGSDFLIEAGADYLYDAGKPNTTTINGIDNSTLSFLNRTGGSGDEQVFWNLVIDKPSDKMVALASGKGVQQSSANNLINVDGNAFKVLSGTFDNGTHSVRLFCDSLVNYDVMGVYDGAVDNNFFIKFTDQPITLVTADTSKFGNVRFNNNNDIVELTSDVYIQRFQYRFGRMNIGEHNLKIDALDINLRADRTDWNGCGGCFSVEDMFITDGNASDGGLSLYVPADGLDPEDGDAIFDFPFGIGIDGLDADVDTGSGTGNSKYTPVSATLSSVTDDGYITFRPVDGVLPTTEPTGGDILSYYWQVTYDEFTTLPTVEYLFKYYDTDLDGSGNEATFVPGKVLDAIPFTRSSEIAANLDDVNNLITFDADGGGGFQLETANYTTGDAARFVGAPEVYYSRQDGNWNLSTSWSTVSHTSGVNTGTFPQAGDVAIIGFDGANDFHRMNAVGDVNVAILEFNSYADATQKNIRLSRVLFGTTEDLNAAIVRGIGELQFASNNGNGPGLISAGTDLGDFVDNSRSSFIYTLGGTGDITIPAIPKYPSIRFYAAGANSSASKTERFFLDRDIECSNLLLDGNAVLEVTNDILVSDTLFIGANRDGELIFNNGASANVVEVDYLIFGSDLFTTQRQDNINKIFVEAGGANGVEHRLIVNNDIRIATGSGGVYPDNGADFDLFTNGTDNNVILELAGAGLHSLEIEGDDDLGGNGIQFIPEFYRVVLDKGSSLSSGFEFADGFTLEGPTNGATKALELQNGTLKLNTDDSDIDIDLTSGGADFTIPAGSALQVTNATVRVSGDDSGIALDGSLIIDGGTVDMDDVIGNGNNYIEYSSSGNAILNISSGALDVGSQIRPNTFANTGILKYQQTGGDVRIGTQAGSESTRGMLQIYNVGSEFTYTGGTLTIERHQTTPSIAALYLDPDISDVTGSTITIFNGNTPAGQSDFRINSFIELNDIVINGNNTPTATLNINGLSVNNMSIASGATLLGDGRTLTMNGNFDNDGTYNAENNETIFSSLLGQSITGAGTNTFFNFTKTEAGTLTLTNSIDVGGLFTITEGTIDDSGFSINLAADAVIDGTHMSVGGSGLVFGGAAAQELRRSGTGTGTLGIISISNTNGVSIPSGNGYDFNISGGLRLDGGVFDIGGSNILFGETADIVPVQPFSVSNMIKTNSSFADKGVGKVFTAGTTTDFTFPMGQTYYTPAIFDFSSGSNTSGSTLGTIYISPANEYHPTIDDGTDATPGGDINNVLQYYWTITAETITGFTSDVTFGYNDALVSAADGTEADYIAARILSFDNPTSAINKYTTAEVDETSNLISFNFNGDDSNGITGDYFAGIDAAIPPTVITYIVANQFGNQDITNTLTYDVSTPLPTDGVPPTGAVIIVPSGTTLKLNTDNIRLYRTEIQTGAVVEVADGTNNHRLGILDGTGDLRIVSNGINANLPAFSGTFLSCSGGGLEYAGTGSYSIMSGISTVRNLTLSGSGNRNLSNNNIFICEDLIVDGPDLKNVNNRRITINGVSTLNSGDFYSGTGNVIFNGDLNVNGGSYLGENGGTDIFVGQVQIDAGIMSLGTGGNYRFQGDLIFNTGTFDGGSGWAIMRLEGSTNQTISGDFTGVNSINRLQLNNAAGFIKTNGNIEIGTYIIFSDGIFDMNSNALIFNNSAYVNGVSGGVSSSYINGLVLKTLTSVGSDFTFPIGSALLWRPASVQNVSIGGLTWEAEYFQNSPTTEALVDNLTPTNPGQIATISDGEYWKISDGNGTPSGATATIGLSWGIESDVSPFTSEREELQVMAWNDAISSWDNYGGINFSGGNTQSEGTFDASAVISFSENIITLGSSDPANALPVELLNFEAKPRETTVELFWQTASEINNDYFTLLRSKDGDYFEEIAVIPGAGQSSSMLDYEYFDERPYSGLSYYKLMQTDFDGTEVDLGIVLVKMENSDGALTITAYPNPFGTEPININIAGLNSNESTELILIDQFGKYIYSQKVQADDSGYLDVEIKSSQSWNSGLYIIRLITEKGLLQNKVIKY